MTFNQETKYKQTAMVGLMLILQMLLQGRNALSNKRLIKTLIRILHFDWNSFIRKIIWQA